MYQAAIDYDPGMHGHFLEYICNKYIFDIILPGNIFFKTGSAHNINLDAFYQQNKQVLCKHYSLLGLTINEDKVIFIKHNQKFDLVLLTNIFYRCNDTPELPVRHVDVDVDSVFEWHSKLIKNDNSTEKSNIFKENIFSKLMDRTHFQVDKCVHSEKKVFNFDYGKFFNLVEFISELQKLALFLEHKVKISNDLINDWYTFIEKNQGYQTYLRVNCLVEKILTNRSDQIEDDFFVHAGINTCLAKIACLYDNEELHGSGEYPTDTQQIYKILLNHYNTID